LHVSPFSLRKKSLQRSNWNEDTATDANGRNLTASGRLVGQVTTDTEQPRRFRGGDGQCCVVLHVPTVVHHFEHAITGWQSGFVSNAPRRSTISQAVWLRTLVRIGKCFVIFVHPLGVDLVSGYVFYAASEGICGVAVLADAKLGKANV
jgi:hypothetical protein